MKQHDTHLSQLSRRGGCMEDAFSSELPPADIAFPAVVPRWFSSLASLCRPVLLVPEPGVDILKARRSWIEGVRQHRVDDGFSVCSWTSKEKLELNGRRWTVFRCQVSIESRPTCPHLANEAITASKGFGAQILTGESCHSRHRTSAWRSAPARAHVTV